MYIYIALSLFVSLCHSLSLSPFFRHSLSLPLFVYPVVALLGRFIGVKDANIRYLGLEAMTRLARSYGPKKAQAHQDSVLESLRDGDISVRR